MQKNLKHSWKRLLACLLAVVMLVGVAPMADVGGTAIKASAKSYVTVNGHTVVDSITFNGATTQAVYTNYYGTGYNSDTTYCCAAFVKRFYRNSYGIDVWNLNYQQVPQTNDGSFYQVSTPQVGDIVRRNSKTHWMIVKAVNGNTVTLIEQNFWTSPYTSAPVDRTISVSDSDHVFFRYSKATNGGGSSSNNPNGCVDSVWGGAGFVHVSGWAFDADDMAAQLNIHVYIGDEGHGWLYANKERTDVNNVYGCGNYHGFDENIQTDKTGTQTVSIYAINVGGGANVLLKQETVNISPAPTYSFDINPVIDGITYDDGKSGFTFDLYLNGSLVADDVIDYYSNSVRGGTTYEVKDIRCPNGFAYAGGTYSGTVNANTDIRPTFSTLRYSLDINGILDGVSEAWLSNYGTCDVYINGTMVANDVSDYCQMHAYGSKYEIKDIKASTGMAYNGVSSGTLSGTIDSNKAVVLNFSRAAYKLYFDVNHDGVRTNYYKPTKSSKTVNGVNYSYDLANNIMTLNGTLTESGTVDWYEFTTAKDTSYKVTATVLSGSVSNGTFVIEACKNDGAGVSGRLYLDVFGSNTSKTWTFTSTTASEVKRIHTWLWKGTGTTTFSNLKVKIKIEKLPSSTSSGTAFSPCMRGMHYNESYGTLMTPTRTGYTFDGWYTAATGGTKVTSASKYPAANQTLYAHWTCNHSYTSQIVTAATCSSTGTKKYTCKTCGNTYTETIAKDANNHTGGTELKNAKSATCGEAGYTGDTCCKGCSAVLTKGTVIPATESHSFGAWKQTKAPTCTAKGEKTRTCSVCGKTETLAVDKIAHTYTATVTEATCTEDGKTVYTCSCGDTYTEVIPAKGHHDEDADGTCDACGLAMGDISKDCSCRCHKTGLNKFIYKIILIFWKLFRINKTCACGAAHY